MDRRGIGSTNFAAAVEKTNAYEEAKSRYAQVEQLRHVLLSAFGKMLRGGKTRIGALHRRQLSSNFASHLSMLTLETLLR